MTATIATGYLRSIDPDAYTRLELDADANALIDAAVAWELLGVELATEQASTVARLFPSRDGEERLAYLARVGAILDAVADDVRTHYLYEAGYLDIDGERVHEVDAIRSLESARWFAAKVIADGGLT